MAMSLGELQKYEDFLKFLRTDPLTVDRKSPWYRAWVRLYIETTTAPELLAISTNIHWWSRATEAWIERACIETRQRNFVGRIPGLAVKLGNDHSQNPGHHPAGYAA
jgi:hypothetical protein